MVTFHAKSSSNSDGEDTTSCIVSELNLTSPKRESSVDNYLARICFLINDLCDGKRNAI